MRRAVVVLVVLAVAAACSSDEQGSAPPVSELGVSATSTSQVAAASGLDLVQVADDVIVPRYVAFVDEANELVTAVDALCADPGTELLERAQAQWQAARAAWRRTMAFESGPAMQLRTMSTVDFVTSPDKVEAFVTASEPVSADTVGQLGANARGLGAVEQLLYGGGASDLLGPAGARRCDYASSASALVGEAAAEVVGAWTEGDEPYREQLDEDRQAALNDVFNDVVGVLQGVADQRLALALGDTTGEPEPDQADPGPAQRALADMLDDLDGAVAAYDAVLAPAIARQSAEAATRTRAELVGGQEALAAITGPLVAAVAADPEGLAAAQEALKQAKRTLATEVASLLGLTLGFSDADGDG